jgi:hypothetical protein
VAVVTRSLSDAGRVVVVPEIGGQSYTAMSRVGRNRVVVYSENVGAEGR